MATLHNTWAPVLQAKEFWVAEVMTLFGTNTLNIKRTERQNGEEGGDAVTGTEFFLLLE